MNCRRMMAVVCLILISVPCAGQDPEKRRITIRKSIFGVRYYMGEDRLDIEGLKRIMQDDPEAVKKLESSKRKESIAKLMGGVGGFCAIYPIGQAIFECREEGPNWALAGCGLAVGIAGLVLERHAHNTIRECVDSYNENLGRTGSMRRIDPGYALQGGGVYLVFRF